MSDHETVVSIPNCSITHVIGTATAIPLTTGDLTLVKYSAGADVPSAPVALDLQGSEDTSRPRLPPVKPLFTLQVGQLAFPLSKTTVFGTDTNSLRRYMFVPDIGPVGQAAQGGYIRLDLPESAVESTDGMNTQQDLFERALINEGLLKEGWEAVREDITKGVKETIDGIRDKVTNTLSSSEGRTPPEAIEPEDSR